MKKEEPIKIMINRIISNWPVKIIALLTFINGTLIIFTGLLFHKIRYSNFIMASMPFGLASFNHSLSLFLGLSLIYLSYNIYRRKIIAWWIVVSILIYFCISHIITFHHLYLLTSSFMTLFLLIAYNHYFVVRYKFDNIFQGIKLAVSIFLIAIIFGTAGFWFLDPRAFGIDFHLSDSLIRTLREYFLISNPDLIPKNRSALLFLQLLKVLGITAFFLAAYSIFKPLYDLKKYSQERELAAKLSEKWGSSSLDFFKLWPPKNYFLEKEKKGFVAFDSVNEVAMALGDPICPNDKTELIARKYSQYCRENGWAPAFYCVTEEFKSVCQKIGLKYLRIGQEAFVDLGKFASVTGQHKDFQRVIRKFEKNDYFFEYLEPPHSDELISELRPVSDDWLKLPGRRERTFAVGYFEKDYLKKSLIFTVKNKERKIVAFANNVRSYKEKEATIDLMRFRRDALNGAMDYLFINILLYFFKKGFRTFDLGLSPISEEFSVSKDSFKERALQEIYKNASVLFSFQGLYNYKRKFDPFWEDRYLIYSGTAINMLLSAMALTKISKIKML